MRITIGTDNGALRVEQGNVETMWAGAPVIGLAGPVALTATGQVVGAADGERQTPAAERVTCVATHDRTVLVGTAGAHVLVLGPSGFEPVKDFDAIEGRDSWYTPSGGPPDTRSIAIDDDGTWFVNVHVGGVWRSAGDHQWDEVVAVDDDTHQVIAQDGWIAVAAAVGAGVSDDGGHTFRWSAAGLHGSYCRAAAIAGDTLLVTASTGPFSRQGAVYRRLLTSSEPFERCRKGLPDWFDENIDSFRLAARGADAAVATSAGDVYASDDMGARWHRVATGIGPVRCISLSSELGTVLNFR